MEILTNHRGMLQTQMLLAISIIVLFSFSSCRAKKDITAIYTKSIVEFREKKNFKDSLFVINEVSINLKTAFEDYLRLNNKNKAEFTWFDSLNYDVNSIIVFSKMEKFKKLKILNRKEVENYLKQINSKNTNVSRYIDKKNRVKLVDVKYAIQNLIISGTLTIKDLNRKYIPVLQLTKPVFTRNRKYCLILMMRKFKVFKRTPNNEWELIINESIPKGCQPFFIN